MATFKMPSHAKTADAFQRAGGRWKPNQHYTGATADTNHIKAVQALIDKYATAIEAYHLYEPFPAMYSLEMQFSDKESLIRCSDEYQLLFPQEDEED